MCSIKIRSLFIKIMTERTNIFLYQVIILCVDLQNCSSSDLTFSILAKYFSRTVDGEDLINWRLDLKKKLNKHASDRC